MIGIFTGIAVNFACRIKDIVGFDDAIDAFGFHGMSKINLGVGGVFGTILTGIFHDKSIALLDGTVTQGGAIDGNWISLGYQVAACVSIAAWSYFITVAICFIIDHIPGLKLGISAEREFLGADIEQMGETVF